MKFMLEISSKEVARRVAESLRDCAKSEPDAERSRELHDVALQLAGSASHLDLGPVCSAHRHATKEGAKLVVEQMIPLTNAKVFVEHDPVTGYDKERGVGDWDIRYQYGREFGSCESHRMSRCASMGETLALADALRRHDPHHPLLRTYHLKPENRSNIGKYYL